MAAETGLGMVEAEMVRWTGRFQGHATCRRVRRVRRDRDQLAMVGQNLLISPDIAVVTVIGSPFGRQFLTRLRSLAGSQDGRTIRLKGMGIRHERGEGDLVCHLQLTVPAILDSASRKLADKLLRSLGLE